MPAPLELRDPSFESARGWRSRDAVTEAVGLPAFAIREVVEVFEDDR